MENVLDYAVTNACSSHTHTPCLHTVFPKLDLDFIEGGIPTTLFQPKHESKLEIFDIGNNFVAGQIPNNIGRLANLKRLALYSCWLTGTIPLSIAELKRLDTLYIDENEIEGTIPTEIGDLSELRDLRLRDNKMNGKIPYEIGKLKNLEILYLDTNQFSGEVPAEVGLMSRLEELHLYKNKFTSLMPESIGDLRYLKLLYLDSNGFIGPIPESYGEELHNLQQFYCYSNKLTGRVPDNIWGLSDIQELRINDNSFEGTLPDTVGELLKLKTLHIENNNFDGTLPGSMKNLEELEKLRISGNSFDGEIPDGLCLLRTSESDSGALEEFVADCNAFQPACPCCTECVTHNKPALEKPDVHEEPEADPTAAPTTTPQEVADNINETDRSDRFNQIKHRLVDEGISTADVLKPPPKGEKRSAQRKALEWIADEDNRQLSASHEFIFERYALACLWYATFDYARLYDAEHPPKQGEDKLPNWSSTNNWMTPTPICSWFGVTCHESSGADGSIDQFNITNNGVRGFVPDEFYRGLTDVSVLDLSHNLFNGTIADGVGHWEDLRLLYLNQNFFTGSVPRTIFSPAHKSQLEIIDLGGNWLSGSIPNEIGDLSSLKRLALYENWISGTIPPFIANCKKLDTLYLDSNDLSGTIPRMLVTELTQLQDLRLRSNHLKGRIPEEIGTNLQKLALLYLDDNELQGSIVSMKQSSWSPMFVSVGGGGTRAELQRTRQRILTYLSLFISLCLFSAFFHRTHVAPRGTSSIQKQADRHPAGRYW